MVNEKLNIKIYLIPVFSIWILNILLLIVTSTKESAIYKYYISLAIVSTYFLALVLSIRKYGIVALQTLFLLCLFLFNYGRIFLYIFGLFDYTAAPYSLISTFIWKYETLVKVDNYYLIFNTLFIFFLLASKPLHKICDYSKNISKLERTMTSEFVRRTFSILFFLILPFMAYSMFKFSFMIMRSGYGALYTGGLQSYEGSTLLRISRTIFNISFYAICMSENDEKRFTRIGIVYIIIMAIQLLQGSRGYFIVALLAIMYIRYRKFGAKIKIRTIVILGVLLVPGIYFIALFRENAIETFSLRDSITYFLSDMSGSLNVPAYYLQNQNSLINNRVPFVLDPIIRILEVIYNPEVYAGGQSIDYINITSDLGHILTYNISPVYYLEGNNVASNFIAELSEFGIIGIILGSFVFLSILFKYDNMFDRNSFYMFMSCEFLLKIFYVPRAEMFYDTYNLFKYGIIYFCIYIMASLMNRKSRKSILKNRIEMRDYDGF